MHLPIIQLLHVNNIHNVHVCTFSYIPFTMLFLSNIWPVVVCSTGSPNEMWQKLHSVSFGETSLTFNGGVQLLGKFAGIALFSQIYFAIFLIFLILLSTSG